jgi:hypothetical protein
MTSERKYKIMKYLLPTGISIGSFAFWKFFNGDCMRAFAVATLLAGTWQSAVAYTLHVNPGGTSGASSSIGAAVNKGGADDTIEVAPGTVISQNVIDDEAIDIVTNTPSQVAVHLNDLLDGKIGVDNIGAGTVDATENWWGCPGGPGEEECTLISGPRVFFTPWLRHPIHEEPK